MVTQTIYVTEADLKAQVSAGKATAPQVVCVLKVVKVDSVIVLPLHQLIVVLQPTVSAALDVLETTAVLCATTEDQVVPFTKLRPMVETATLQVDSAV